MFDGRLFISPFYCTGNFVIIDYNNQACSEDMKEVPMVIFVTDAGRYWNHNNPILENYAACVVVVCLNGKAVTDKYQCVVSPYKPIGMGTTDYGVSSAKFNALKTICDELIEECNYHQNIVFLADQEPESLYPYLLLKDEVEYNNLHLWCMSPWGFEGKRRQENYASMLGDMSRLMSLHYVDGDECLDMIKDCKNIVEARAACEIWLNSMLPAALYEIDEKLEYDERYYYEKTIHRYVCTDNSYDEIIHKKPLRKKQIDKHEPARHFSTLGLVRFMDSPDTSIGVQQEIERLQPRLDGKEICNKLKEMRVALAEANGIMYETVNCPSTGPCAGTCMQCDREVAYLQEQLSQIPESERIYPQYEVKSYPQIKIVEKDATEELLMGMMLPPDDEHFS